MVATNKRAAVRRAIIGVFRETIASGGTLVYAPHIKGWCKANGVVSRGLTASPRGVTSARRHSPGYRKIKVPSNKQILNRKGNYMNLKKNRFFKNLAPLALTSCGLICWSAPSDAKVTSIVIDSTTTVAGASIPYETFTGRIFGTLDPKISKNSIIQDIGLAPKGKDGSVPYTATFQITTPVSAAQRTGLMIYEVSNRGRNAIPAASSLIPGVTYAESGWQGDLLANCTTSYPCTSLNTAYTGSPSEVIQVPVAHNPDGSTITGPVYGYIANASGNTAQMIVFT